MLIRRPEDAEAAAAAWMRANGWPDAKTTGAGADGGLDVVASGAVAQVKAEMKPSGRPVVQALYGIAAHARATPLFFSLAGYTPEAVAWADDAGVALLSFDLQGDVEPVNRTAAQLPSPDDDDPPALTADPELRARIAEGLRGAGVNLMATHPGHDPLIWQVFFDPASFPDRVLIQTHVPIEEADTWVAEGFDIEDLWDGYVAAVREVAVTTPEATAEEAALVVEWIHERLGEDITQLYVEDDFAPPVEVELQLEVYTAANRRGLLSRLFGG